MAGRFGTFGPVKDEIRRILLWRTTEDRYAMTRGHLDALVARAFPDRPRLTKTVGECLRQMETSGHVVRVADDLNGGRLVVVVDRAAIREAHRTARRLTT